MKILINPAFSGLRPFINRIQDNFNAGTEIIHQSRNTIKLFTLESERIAIKSFGVPHLINRIAYTYIRKSKARRSYEHAFILQEKGINTPAPIAYVEDYRLGLLEKSYYICLHTDFPGMMRIFRTSGLEGNEELLRTFARFTASMHDKEVLHKDYSPGNILFKETAGKYEFCIIDINRMEFGPVDMEKGCANLRRLWGNDETIEFIAKEYAAARNFDKEECVEITFRHHRQFWKRFGRRHHGAKPFVGTTPI